MAPNLLMPAILSPLIALMVWRRVRRQFGRQAIRHGAMIGRIAILSVVGCLAMLAGFRDVHLLEGLLAGILAGAALGLLGLRLTRFERGADGADLYIPNPWVGGAVTMLLVARLAWRFLVLATMTGATSLPPTAPQFGSSPLTLLVLGLMVGYYVSYYAGLLIHHGRLVQARA